jgi:hypothetical protein
MIRMIYMIKIWTEGRVAMNLQEPFSVSSYSSLKNYAPAIRLKGENIYFCGRGTLDAMGCTTHAHSVKFLNV